MSWIIVGGAAISAAPALIGGGKGPSGPRNISFENVNSDPWAVQQYQNAQQGLQGQQQFANQTAAQNGLGNQANVFQQQQQLANQFQMQANGQGPNPAQAQLANSTGQNAAQQAALMGSQRGASANAGLMARQIGQQGASIQQQSVGQAAALQAQQQIAAQQQLQQQQAMMANLSTNQVGQQAGALNAFQTGAQNLYATQSQNVNAWNSGQISAATGASHNDAAFGMQQNAQQNQAIGGAMNGLGGALGLTGASGNNSSSPAISGSSLIGANSNFTGGGTPGFNPNAYAGGGSVHGGPSSHFARKCMNMKSGGQVPGQAKVAGNSPKNDTVHAMLSPGEAVIDRETLARKDAVGKAARMVTAYINKRNGKK